LNIYLVSKFSDVKLDWTLVVIGMGMLWLTGLLATLAPALRASDLSPAIATRSV
jgi:putative ABC transport system permease protein